MKLNKSKLLTGSIVLIALLNCLVWGYILLKKHDSRKIAYKNADGRMLQSKIKLPAFLLKTADDLTITSGYLCTDLNVLIFFTMGDCPACLFEAEYWGLAAQGFDKTQVTFLGFTMQEDKEIINTFSHGYRIPFPILVDKNGNFKKQVLALDEISHNSIISPFKIFVNRNHEIVYIEGPVKDPGKQTLFQERVAKILNDIQ